MIEFFFFIQQQIFLLKVITIPFIQEMMLNYFELAEAKDEKLKNKYTKKNITLY